MKTIQLKNAKTGATTIVREIKGFFAKVGTPTAVALPNKYILVGSLYYLNGRYYSAASYEVAQHISELVRAKISQLKDYYIVDDGSHCEETQNVIYIKTCKEFDQLINYIRKYSKTKLGPLDIYSVPTSGKRGRYFEDLSEIRGMLALSPTKCDKYLEQLRKLRATGDVITVTKEVEKDEEDYEHSVYYETECYGFNTHKVVIQVRTPKTNKLKGTIILTC